MAFQFDGFSGEKLLKIGWGFLLEIDSLSVVELKIVALKGDELMFVG